MIDWEKFNDTYKHYGNDVVVQIIDIFAEDHAEDMKLIEQAIINKDFQALRFSAHHIKGSILNFWDSKTAELAYKLEYKGEYSIEDGQSEALTELKPAVATLLQELLDYRKKIIS